MKKICSLFIMWIFFVTITQGQEKNIILETSKSIDNMIDAYIRREKGIEKVRAWRIQIITTDDRRKMEQALASFRELYPNVTAEWNHVSPYYQVRVGFYETKNKLMPFLLEIKKLFPSATPVYDSVSKRALIYN